VSARQQVSAGELVATGHCSAACLLALEVDGKCRCRCDGLYHGTVAETPVEAVATTTSISDGSRPWFGRYTYYSQFYLDMVCPVVRTTRRFNQVWVERKSSEEVFSVARQDTQLYWTAATDAFTAKDDYREDMRATGERLAVAALVAKSNKAAVAEIGPTRLSVGGLRAAHDAQVLACAFSELWFYNADGAIGLYLALREDIEREQHRPVCRSWLVQEEKLPRIEFLTVNHRNPSRG
jgi:hypothetical protein